ncbi:MAG: hypothetical protein LJE96_18880, partial [Deltaproteobacteria bacterium]|nr:hypothetical protein [Deltaproteobacteria bacterium]
MKNGDRIQGTVISMSQGKLLFKTSYAGEISIKWDQVAKLTTDEPFEVSMGEDKTFRGKLTTSASGDLELKPDEGAPPPPLKLAQVKTMTRPKPPAWDYTGNVNAGASKETGNTNTQKYSFIGNLKVFKF